MTKMISRTDCGNSPKMEFLKQFNIAFAEGNVIFLKEGVTDDIIWNIIGDRKIEGRANFVKALEELQSLKASELMIDQILSHGKEGAVNGWMIMENGKNMPFQIFISFKMPKVKKLKL